MMPPPNDVTKGVADLNLPFFRKPQVEDLELLKSSLFSDEDLSSQSPTKPRSKPDISH